MAHTHPQIVVESFGSYQGEHVEWTSLTNCGSGTTHRHDAGVADNVADRHFHLFTFDFAPAELGSPNWWEHKHTIIVTAVSFSGAPHTHGIVNPTWLGNCRYSGCSLNKHAHSHTLSASSGGGSHNDHPLNDPFNLTDNAAAEGTPASHRHSVYFYTGSGYSFPEGGSHAHGVTGSVNVGYCYLAYEHTHAGTTTTAGKHPHQFAGYWTGYGGEAPPAVAFNVLMDGLVCIVS